MTTPAPSRRALLGAAATLPLAALPVAATAASGDDAELLRLCARFHCRHAAANAVLANDDDALHAAMDTRWATSNLIRELRPTTAAGHRAKAGVALVLLDENSCAGGRSVDSDVDFAHATLADLAGAAVTLPVVAAQAPKADVELTALADKWQHAHTFVQKGSQRGNDISDDAFNDMLDQRNATTGRIADIRAVTLAGMAAKARIVDDLTIEAECCDPNRHDQVARSLARDVMALT